MRTRTAETTRALVGLREALVTAVRDDELRVKPVGSRPRSARLAAQGYTPRVGDRVLVAPGDDGETLFLLAPLFHAAPEATRAPGGEVRTPSGASASVEGDTVLVRDTKGRVVVRFDAASGTASISAPDGDLELAAPAGAVKIRAEKQLSLESEGAITQRARERLELRAGDGPALARVTLDQDDGATIRGERVAIDGARLEARVDEVSLRAERVATVVTEVAHAVGRVELRARQLVERVGTATRDVEGLLLTRAQRSRTLVKDALESIAKRTRIVSKEDSSIDGRRVLLG